MDPGGYDAIFYKLILDQSLSPHHHSHFAFAADMIVACVRTGDKYPVLYVHRLKAMVARHLQRQHDFVCFTDNEKEVREAGIVTVGIEELRLKSWWGKMALLAHDWREGQRVLYFDLDTVVVGDLTPLSDLSVEFGICANFTRAAGNLEWPCRYGSCVMSIGPSFDGEAFGRFWLVRHEMMARAGKYGDQKAIEELLPSATILQELLPQNYFLGYRDLPMWEEAPPQDCSLVIFAGRTKPHNCGTGWVRREWKHK